MQLFEILAEPIRRRIFEVLASGEHSAARLSAVIRSEFAVGRPAVSNHLRIMRENAVVEVRGEGARRVYRLVWDVVDRLEREVDHFRDLWDQRTGYPYRNDPLEPFAARRQPPSKRGRRGRQHPSRRSEVELIPASEYEWFD